MTTDDMTWAAQQLARSHKGQDAMRAILAWLDDGGCSLDRANQEAVYTLLSGAWGPFAGSAREAMREQLTIQLAEQET